MVAGTERVVSDKINWLAEHGYEVTLVHSRGTRYTVQWERECFSHQEIQLDV